MKKQALLIIDMQKDLCYDKRRHKKVVKLLPHLQTAIQHADENGFAIYYICFELKPDDIQFKRYGDQYCIEGTPGAEIIDELQPVKGTIIKKRKHSAFFETELDDLLKQSKIDKIYMTGMQTQLCIMTTAADASFRGYDVSVIADCVLSTREKNKTWALNWIDKHVGKVITLDEFCSGSV